MVETTQAGGCRGLNNFFTRLGLILNSAGVPGPGQ